ncbi:MAG: hypothetical protein V7750_07345 [Sneathiella sp.]
MKFLTLFMPLAFLLLAASFNANSASVSAGSNTGNSAGWPSHYDHYLKAQQADMIKKADKGYYDGYTYNTYYDTYSYDYTSTIEVNIETINFGTDDQSNGCGGGNHNNYGEQIISKKRNCPSGGKK